MRRMHTPSRGQIRKSSCPKATEPSPVAGTEQAARKKTDQTRAFEELTFPYVEAIHVNALCLSGSKDVALELVVATYTAAFLDYEKLRSIPATGACREQDTLAWLYRHMHSIYCDILIAQAHRTSPVLGGPK